MTVFLGITAVSAADSSSNIQSGPDLVMTNLTTPNGGAPGGQIIAPNTVKNQGNTTAGGFYVTYYLTTTHDFNNATLLGSHYIPSNDYLGIFGAGLSKSDNTRLTIPSNVAVGQYYFVAVADGFNNVEETNENNNVLFSNTKINIQNGPDLLMTSLNVPATVIRGQNIDVSNTVENFGNMSAGGFYINYYLTSAQNLIVQTKIGSRYIKSLAAGTSNTAKTTLIIPRTITTGQYYIAAVVDSTKLINEVNESNNMGFSAFKMNVLNGRDLVMTSLTAVASGLNGAITVNNTVKNLGNVATGGFYVTFYLTKYQNMNVRTKIGSRYIKSLAAGTSNTAKTTLIIPRTITTGQYYIAAVVDSTKLINEVNESNNNQYSTGKINVIYDGTAPQIKKVIPASNATRVSLTSLITITFSENIKAGANFAGIYIKNLTTEKTVTIASKIINRKILILKMKFSRIRNNLYQVYIPGCAVKDFAGNVLKIRYTYKFRTIR